MFSKWTESIPRILKDMDKEICRTYHVGNKMRWIALSQYSIPCYLLCLLYLVPSLHGLITCLLPPWAHTSLFGQHLAWDSPHWVWVGSRIIEWVKQENRSLFTRYSLFPSLSLKSWYEVVILLILWPSERERESPVGACWFLDSGSVWCSTAALNSARCIAKQKFMANYGIIIGEAFYGIWMWKFIEDK